MKELYYLESVAAGVEYTKEVVAKNPNLRELLQKHGVDFEKFKTSCNPFDFDFFFFDSGKNKYSALLTVGNQILYHCKVVNHSGPVKLAKVKSVENFPGIDKDYCFVFFEVQHEFAENISGSDIFNYKYFIKNKILFKHN